MRKSIWLGSLACLLCLGTGCVLDQIEYLSPPEVGSTSPYRCTPSDDSDPSVDVSYSRDVKPLLVRQRAGCSCHLPTSLNVVGLESTGLDLSTYGGLMAGGTNSSGTIVVPGKPCESVLVQKVGQAPPFGNRMPLAGPPYLASSEIQVIKDWIAEGALEN